MQVLTSLAQVEGLLSFLYTGACSLSPDQADILNILQVSILLDYLFAFCPFTFLLLSYSLFAFVLWSICRLSL